MYKVRPGLFMLLFGSVLPLQFQFHMTDRCSNAANGDSIELTFSENELKQCYFLCLLTVVNYADDGSGINIVRNHTRLFYELQ